MLQLLISGCSAAICSVLCLFFWSTSRADGWRHYRYYALVALVSAIYGVCGLPIQTEIFSIHPSVLFSTLSLIIALLTPVFWFAFLLAQEDRVLRPLERIAVGTLLLGVAITCVPGATFGELHRIGPTWTGATYIVLNTNALGDFLIFVMMASFFSIAYGYAKPRERGASRQLVPMFASLAFVVGAVEEGLVVMNMIPWPFMGSIGFSVGNILMALEMARKVVQNARDVESLNLELQNRIVDSTNNLMSTRQALIASERHTAMGSLAAGVSHEINNPLAYVSGNLEFVRDTMVLLPDREEELSAIDDAIIGVERIQEVIANQKMYVRSQGSDGLANIHKTIEIALRVVKPQIKYSTTVEVQVDEEMFASIDESRLVQVLVNLVLNAALSKRDGDVLMNTTLRAFRKGDLVCIEVSDNDGRAQSTLRAGKMAQFVDDSSMAKGDIAVFVCRGIVETCGGTVLSLRNDAGKLVVRVTLPIVESGCNIAPRQRAHTP